MHTVFPAHGELIHNHRELINNRLAKMDVKAEKLLQLIKSGHSTANELALIYYKKQYNTEFSLVMSEIIGHLDYLETKNKVEKKMKHGVWRYHAS